MSVFRIQHKEHYMNNPYKWMCTRISSIHCVAGEKEEQLISNVY